MAGAVLAAPEIAASVGGDLTVALRQDTSRGGSTSQRLSGSVTVGLGGSPGLGSVSASGGRSTIDRAWADERAGLQAEDWLSVSVDGHTQVDGAVLALRTGNLSLDTDTLGVSDLADHDRSRSFDLTLGGSFSTPSGWRGQDVGSINRDVGAAQQVTKDTKSGGNFYGSTSAAQEAASGFQGIRQGSEQSGRAAREGSKDLPAQVRATVTAVAQQAGSAGRTLQGVIDAPASSTCTWPPSRGPASAGPDWILNQVGDTRARQGLTVFADPTTEHGLIRQALVQQTGRALRKPFYTDAEQQRQVP